MILKFKVKYDMNKNRTQSNTITPSYLWNFIDEIDTAFTDKVNGIYYNRRGDKLVLGQNMEKTNEIKLKDSRNGSYISEAYLLNDEGKTIERLI